MSDLNWCTFCDSAIDVVSDSLYCSEECLRADALRNHPSLGYKFKEFVNFPRPCSKKIRNLSASSSLSSLSLSPSSSSSTSSSSSSAISILTCATSIPSNTSSICSSPENMNLYPKYFTRTAYNAVY